MLGCAPPQIEPRATEHIAEMIEIIRELEAKGLAYAADGDVYFAVDKLPAYGKLSGRRLDDMMAGARIEVDERKHHPMDFALWKAGKPGEPAWDSPWGTRPAGLAHRVFGDGQQVSRPAVRHSRRRQRPHLPAPRERDRAERGRARADRSRATGCTTAW